MGLAVAALKQTAPEISAVCTDLFPNRPALARVAAGSGGRIGFRTEPVDATAVPRDLRGLRTLFNAFHHFRPPAARRILEDAVDAAQPIAVVEIVGRQAHAVPGMMRTRVVDQQADEALGPAGIAADLSATTTNRSTASRPTALRLSGGEQPMRSSRGERWRMAQPTSVRWPPLGTRRHTRGSPQIPALGLNTLHADMNTPPPR